LQISSYYKRANGTPYLCLVIENKGSSTLNRAQLRLDDNVLGVTPGGFSLPGPVGPGQTATVDVPLVASKNPVDKNNRAMLMAVKQDMSKAILYCTDPSLSSFFHIMFEDKPALEKNAFLKQWFEIPDTSEHTGQITNLKYGGIEAIKTRLAPNNVHFVAHRPKKPNGDALYFSLSVRGTSVLVEITIQGGVCSGAVKCKTPLFASITLTAMQKLLST
jgi:hypothetical protein